nr:elongation factor 2-like [Tanacetum cinerariifolium]
WLSGCLLCRPIRKKGCATWDGGKSTWGGRAKVLGSPRKNMLKPSRRKFAKLSKLHEELHIDVLVHRKPEIALAIKDEVEDLEKAGITVIKINEAALREGLPLNKTKHAFYLDWVVHSFIIINVGVADTTQVLSGPPINWNIVDPKFGVDESKMLERLWGDNYFDPNSRKWTTKNTGSADCKRGFVQFVYEPIKQIINLCMNEWKDELHSINKLWCL